MKLVCESTFHPQMSVTFIGIKEGVNVRRLIGGRHKYCLDYRHDNSHVCGCGYPLARTEFTLPDGYEVRDVYVRGPYGQEYGRTHICFEVAKQGDRR